MPHTFVSVIEFQSIVYLLVKINGIVLIRPHTIFHGNTQFLHMPNFCFYDTLFSWGQNLDMDIKSCKKNDYVLPGVLSGLQRYIHPYFSGEQPRTQDKMEDRCFGIKNKIRRKRAVR